MTKNILLPIKHSIINIKAEAIAYSANRTLQKGSGMCKHIYEAAGEELLTKAVSSLAPLEMGNSLLSPAFNLPAKYLIHTVTPKYFIGDTKNNIALFSHCYASILKICYQNNIKTLALPCLGIGHHGWPVQEMIRICIDTVLWSLSQHTNNLEKIYLVCLNDEIKLSFEEYIAKSPS